MVRSFEKFHERTYGSPVLPYVNPGRATRLSGRIKLKTKAEPYFLP